MVTLFLLVLGFLVAVVVGSIMLHVLLALILFPFKLGLGLLKLAMGGLLLLPLMAVGFAMLVAFLAVGGIVGGGLWLLFHLF